MNPPLISDCDNIKIKETPMAIKTTRLKIDAYRDREAIVMALANSGYKVWVEEKDTNFSTSSEFFVCIEERRAD